MKKSDLQKVRDALAVATTPLAKDRQTVIAAVRILDAALAAEPQQPAVWMQSNHLTAFISHACGSDSMLARCSDHQLMPDYQPLFTAPVAAPDDAIDWEGIAADQAMTIAMLKVDYQQLQALVTSQGIRLMEAEDDAKDAARWRFLRDHPEQASMLYFDSDHWESAIDEAMQQEQKS